MLVHSQRTIHWCLWPQWLPNIFTLSAPRIRGLRLGGVGVDICHRRSRCIAGAGCWQPSEQGLGVCVQVSKRWATSPLLSPPRYLTDHWSLGGPWSRPRSGRGSIKHQDALSPWATVHLWYKYKIRILEFKPKSPESYSTAHSAEREQSPPGEVRSAWHIWESLKLFHIDIHVETILRTYNIHMF